MLIVAAALIMYGCGSGKKNVTVKTEAQQMSKEEASKLMQQYAEVTLTADLHRLDKNDKIALTHLIAATDVMNTIFWKQNYGEGKDQFLASIVNPDLRKYAEINYGPWDQFNGQKSFIAGYDDMPLGAACYPADMTKEEFDTWTDPDKLNPYTMVVRDRKGKLTSVPYHVHFADEIALAASHLREAATHCTNAKFADYLNLRAQALETDEYFNSDMLWMDVRDSNLDVVIGPIENYIDQINGAKTAYEGYVLLKDIEMSRTFEHYNKLLGMLQKQLPVEDKYKAEEPGTDSDLAVYDVLYYAGDCNMAGKTIAINLPNDETIQLEKGTRKLQLRNAMRAKYNKILVPLANQLMTAESMENVSFDAFFANVMFHEVAHGLGIKNTIHGKMSVREALKDQYSALEEAKADVVGLYLVTKLHEMGEYKTTSLVENYTTFMAGIFRSVRFGASSAHGKANMLTFNYFEKFGAFTRNDEGLYSINFEIMRKAVEELARDIIVAQGDGNYIYVKKWIESIGVMTEELSADLAKVENVPVDIYFNMGPDVLKLNGNTIK